VNSWESIEPECPDYHIFPVDTAPQQPTSNERARSVVRYAMLRPIRQLK